MQKKMPFGLVSWVLGYVTYLWSQVEFDQGTVVLGRAFMLRVRSVQVRCRGAHVITGLRFCATALDEDLASLHCHGALMIQAEVLGAWGWPHSFNWDAFSPIP